MSHLTNDRDVESMIHFEFIHGEFVAMYLVEFDKDSNKHSQSYSHKNFIADDGIKISVADTRHLVALSFQTTIKLVGFWSP